MLALKKGMSDDEVMAEWEAYHNKISDDRYYDYILAAKSLLDGREVHLRRMTFNLRLAVTEGPKDQCYQDEYCYHFNDLAWLAFETWDGERDPMGWAKHPRTGRRGPGWDAKRHGSFEP